MHFSWSSLRTFGEQTSPPRPEAQASQRHGEEGCQQAPLDTVESSLSGVAAAPAASPVALALRTPERGHAAGAHDKVANRAVPETDATGHLETRQALTLAALDAWAAAPHQSPQEHGERQRLVAQLTSVSLLSFGRRRLKVPEDLDLSGCTALAGLPEGLNVGGYLDLSGCTALAGLPKGLNVGGYLDLRDCTALAGLPKGLNVGGYLDLSGCTALTGLNVGFRVPGLNLSGCTALAGLPEALRVRGNLNLSGCTALARLPEGLRVGGDLDVFGCTALARLPEGLRVGGNLYLFGCTALARLPESLRVGGNLSLRGCTALAGLPESLRVGGNLYLGGCTSLFGLPEGLRVGEDLDLFGCTALARLPESLRVGGDLYLFGCTALARLPESLRVGGNLYLRGCTALARLPESLRVGGNLYLGGCTSLFGLPEGLRVGEDLDLRGCTALAGLPEAILRWPPIRDGRPHRIDITGSGIPPSVVVSIQHAAGEGVQVVFGAGREHDARAGFVDLAAALAFWQPLAGGALAADDAGRGAQPGPIAAQPHELRGLLDFLARLQGTADYRNARSRPLLARRVLHLLQRMQGSSEIAALCHERIGQALESCGDRVIWAMNQLELALRTHAAQRAAAPEAALRSLGTALVRLEVVHRHAADKCTALRVVDPIEVYLAYETALAGPLQLPLTTQGMLYAGLSNVTQDDIEGARQAATRAGEDVQRVEAYLRAWAPWQAHLRRGATANVGRVWHQLAPSPAPVPVADDDRCTFTLETLAELRASGGRPVVVAGPGGAWQVYDLASLLTWYQERGTHPMDADRPLRLEDIRRLPVA